MLISVITILGLLNIHLLMLLWKGAKVPSVARFSSADEKRNELTLLVLKTFLNQRVGLYNHHKIPSGFGVLFWNVTSLQTFGMREPLDIVFLDKGGEVIEILEYASPGIKISPKNAFARHSIELKGGEAFHYFKIGQKIQL